MVRSRRIRREASETRHLTVPTGSPKMSAASLVGEALRGDQQQGDAGRRRERRERLGERQGVEHLGVGRGLLEGSRACILPLPGRRPGRAFPAARVARSPASAGRRCRAAN